MVALAVWGLAIVRGLTRIWCKLTYRTGSRELSPYYRQGLETLKNRTEPFA